MNELYKTSFQLDEKILKKYGAILEADAEKLSDAYENFKIRAKGFENNKLLLDLEFDSFSDDCARLFKSISGHNCKYTKEKDFLKLVIDLLGDRKLFREKLIEVLGDLTHLEKPTLNRHKEASTEFQNYLNNFTKLKLELLENRIQRVFKLNETLQIHLAHSVLSAKELDIDPTVLRTVRERFNQRALHLDQIPGLMLEKEFERINPYFNLPHVKVEEKSDIMIVPVSKKRSNEFIFGKSQFKPSKKHISKDTAMNLTLLEVSKKDAVSFSAEQSINSSDRSKGLPHPSSRMEAKKYIGDAATPKILKKEPKLNQNLSLKSKQEDLSTKSLKRIEEKFLSKNPKMLSFSHNSTTVPILKFSNEASLTARNHQKAQYSETEAPKPTTRRRTMSSLDAKDPLRAVDDLEIYSDELEQSETPRPRGRDVSGLGGSTRSSSKLNPDDLSRIREESKEFASFHALKTPLKILNDKLEMLNNNAEKVINGEGPQSHSPIRRREIYQSETLKSITDSQIDQIVEDNERLYKKLFNEKPSAALNHSSIETEIERKKEVIPVKHDPNFSICESIINSCPEIESNSKFSSTHASTKNLLLQLNAKTPNISPTKKQNHLGLNLKKIEETDSNLASRKQTHRSEGMGTSPSFGSIQIKTDRGMHLNPKSSSKTRKTKSNAKVR